MEVGIQGVLGSFHNQAASQYFDDDVKIKPYVDFRSLAKAVSERDMDYGVMAIENTIAGSILPNYALMNEYDLEVTGEVYLRIEMALIGHKGTNTADLKQVYSHPMALLQCADFFASYPGIKLTEYDDTASSVKLVKDKGLKDAAAIASKKTAVMFGLEVLHENIETNKKNYTRFLILKSKLDGQAVKPEKASLRIVTKHDPGSLSEVLVAFKEHKINMTKIQSMPLIGQPYRYAFNIDVVWSNYGDYERAMEQVKMSSESIKVHGEYKKGNIPEQ
ncbi:MAG: prephenate dehydratase [Reichenbachiella sp.]